MDKGFSESKPSIEYNVKASHKQETAIKFPRLRSSNTREKRNQDTLKPNNKEEKRKHASATRHVIVEFWEQGSKEAISEQSADIDLDLANSNKEPTIESRIEVKEIDLSEFSISKDKNANSEKPEESTTKQESVAQNDTDLEVIATSNAQDLRLEKVSSDGSYNDLFLHNAVLNEDMIEDATPIHEQTATFLLHKTSFEESADTEDDQKEICEISSHSPVVIKPIVKFILNEAKTVETKKVEEVKGQEFIESEEDNGKYSKAHPK